MFFPKTRTTKIRTARRIAVLGGIFLGWFFGGVGFARDLDDASEEASVVLPLGHDAMTGDDAGSLLGSHYELALPPLEKNTVSKKTAAGEQRSSAAVERAPAETDHVQTEKAAASFLHRWLVRGAVAAGGIGMAAILGGIFWWRGVHRHRRARKIHKVRLMVLPTAPSASRESPVAGTIPAEKKVRPAA